jgi:hypothetical protein
MGFLIGKGNETLQEFETTNQDIKFDDFINPERSINKSAQSYAFREKGSFNYEFQFMSDTVYQNMLYLLKNRSSLREGLLLVPIPYSLQSAASIQLPTYNTNNKFYFGETLDAATKPWTKTWAELVKNELTEAQYGKIRVDDLNYVNLLAGDGVPYFLAQFSTSAFTTLFTYKELRRLTLSYIGMNSSPMRFFIWSPSRALWYLIDDRYYYDDTAFDMPGGSGAFSLNKQLISSFTLPWGLTSIYSDFVDVDGTVKFMISGNVVQPMIVQYVRLLINGYWVMMAGPQDFENFETAFTGAGRNGQVALLEM